MAYGLTGTLGFAIGMGLGIVGRGCPTPGESFLECALQDPFDTFIPAVSLSLLALAVVAAVDWMTSAVKAKVHEIPRWRRWAYVALLVVVGLPAVTIAVQQARGQYSDPDPLIIFQLGTWIISLFIAVDFLIWVFRRFKGWRRLGPVVLVALIGVMTYYLVTRDPEFSCINDFPWSDAAGCFSGLELQVAIFATLAAMVAAMFWRGHPPTLSSGS